jgi:hypothetical protein
MAIRGGVMDIEKLKRSTIWDKRYDLPLFPELNNPWIYSAYVWKLLGKPSEMIGHFITHSLKCFNKSFGVYRRWPDGSGGKFSHDEIIGMAYVMPSAAFLLLEDLAERDGLYNENDTEADNMYRFIFLVPFLRQCAGFKVSLISQAKYIAHILFSAFTWKGGSSGPLKIWLMNDKMRELPLCALAIYFYEMIMNKKGVTLAWMLKEHFPQYTEVQELVK